MRLSLLNWICCGFALIAGLGLRADASSSRLPSIQHLKNSTLELEVELPTLAMKTVGVRSYTLSRPLDKPLDIDEGSIKSTGSEISFRTKHSNLRVNIALSGAKVVAKFDTDHEQSLYWPVTGADEAALGLIVPVSEGLFLPSRDPFWRSYVAHGVSLDSSGMSMPFWGLLFPQASITYVLLEDIRSQLALGSAGDLIAATAKHEFKKIDGFKQYRVEIAIAGPGPVAPAKVYRDLLIENGALEKLSDKVRENPEIEKLFGAVHGYLYGKARHESFFQDLKRLGVERAALFYDQDPRQKADLVGPSDIAVARELGYIIGPYETFNNIDDPKTANSYCAIYDDELYKHGSIVNANGQKRKGFGGYGFELSSQALKQSKRDFFSQRLSRHKESGANGLFIDCDGFGELFDDFSKEHPMSKAQDRDNRLARLRIASAKYKFVLGTESAAGWSTPAIAFSHGTITPQTSVFWATLSNKKVYGGYWPGQRPAIFFREIAVSDRLKKADFSPQYRLPLFETVYHDSIVATDRWDCSVFKFPELAGLRTNLCLLYGVPAMWNFDPKALQDHGTFLHDYCAFFQPFHRAIASLPMTDFEWLTRDRLVQRSRFGDVAEVTVNFSDKKFEDIAPAHLKLTWMKEHRSELFPATKPAIRKVSGHPCALPF